MLQSDCYRTSQHKDVTEFYKTNKKAFLRALLVSSADLVTAVKHDELCVQAKKCISYG